ncbi:MAG: mechanosensitive ion channel family protein [Roseburia sp.]
MIPFYMLTVEASTEEITAEEMAKVLEKVKEPGVIQSYLEGIVPNVLAFLFQVVVALLIYLIGGKIIKLVRRLVKKMLDRRDADEGLKQFLDALIKFLCYFFLIMIILSLFGIATTSAIAVLGSAGLTIGMALQGSLSNFAGGVLILLLKPFRVGDYIVEDSHGNEGTVDEISVFYTKLRSVDNRVIVIPNGTLANSSLTNVTHCEKRMVDIKVGVSYGADLKTAKEVVLRVLLQDPDRLPQEEPKVFVSELGDSAVILGARIWTSTEKYWECRWRLMEQIKIALDANHIEIPYQQLDINIKK